MDNKSDNIQQTEAEILREILEVATDNSYLKIEAPETYQEKVIQDMVSLVKMAKKDPAILDFYHRAGIEPTEALNALLQKAVNTIFEVQK